MRSASRRTRVHDAFVGEPVVEHDVGLLHQAEGAEGQEVGVARTRADEIDLAARRLARVRRPRVRSARASSASAPRSSPESARSPIGPSRTASQNRRRMIGEGIASATAMTESARQPRQAAVGGGDQAFEPCLQHAAQYRRRAAGRDRNDERATVDDRGHDEVAEPRPVGDVDQRARALRRRPRLGRQALSPRSPRSRGAEPSKSFGSGSRASC